MLLAHRNPQPKWHLERFSHFAQLTAACVVGHARVCPFAYHKNTCFLRPIVVLNPNGISIGSVVFAGFTTVTHWRSDRQTDHDTRSVTIGRIYAHSTAMRPNNNVKFKHYYAAAKVIKRRKYNTLTDTLWLDVTFTFYNRANILPHHMKVGRKCGENLVFCLPLSLNF